MNFNWGVFIAALALFVSVFSPLITAVINNVFQNKKHKQEFEQQHRAEVIERYLNAVGEALYRHDFESIRKYGGCYAEIYLYVPRRLWDILDNIGFDISEENYDAAKGPLAELAKQLTHDPPRVKKKKRYHNM